MRAAFLACLLLALPMSVSAWHGEVCNPDGASEPLEVETPAGPIIALAGSLAPHATAKWTFSVGDGDFWVLIQASGDLEMMVCRVDAPIHRHACVSYELFPKPDTCLVGQASSGPPLQGPGEFVAYLLNCSQGPPCGDPELELAYVGFIARVPFTA